MKAGRLSMVLLAVSLTSTALAALLIVDLDSRSAALGDDIELLRAHLRLGDHHFEEMQHERNEMRSVAAGVQAKLDVACNHHGRLAPRLILRPRRPRVGETVTIRGSCFIGELSHLDRRMRMTLNTRRGGRLCDLVVHGDGHLSVGGQGRLWGRFVAPGLNGPCIRDARERSTLLGRYEVSLGCDNCRGTAIQISRRRYWWIDDLDEAIAFAARKVDVPVALPRLPVGARVDRHHPLSFDGGRKPSVTLYVRLGEGRQVALSYGADSIWNDGCEPPPHTDVDINGQRGLLAKNWYGRYARAQKEWEVVWPVAEGSFDGAYGVRGDLSRDAILELARSMEFEIRVAPVHTQASC